jgi:hypothetical protein
LVAGKVRAAHHPVGAEAIQQAAENSLALLFSLVGA